MRKQLNGAKTAASTEDRGEVRPAKEIFKISSPFLRVAGQIAFSIVYRWSKLDLKPLLPYSINPGKQ
jgi:hypothetical protein